MFCDSYCSHGGICIVKGEHETHSSNYCTWTDAEALSKVEADALFFAKSGDDPIADFIASMT